MAGPTERTSGGVLLKVQSAGWKAFSLPAGSAGWLSRWRTLQEKAVVPWDETDRPGLERGVAGIVEWRRNWIGTQAREAMLADGPDIGWRMGWRRNRRPGARSEL